MEFLKKEENSKAYESYLYNRAENVSLSADEMIGKFKELFMGETLTDSEKGKYRDTVCFTIGADRASYNRAQTAVLMCEMPNNITLGLTRNMTIVDLTTKTAYNLKYGLGYKTFRNFIKAL